MKKIWLFAAILMAAATFAFGQEGNGNLKTNAGGDEQAIRRTLDDFTAAIGRNDTAALGGIYADDYTLVNPTGALLTREQALTSLKTGELKFESFTHADVKIRLYGDAAIATTRVKVRGAKGDQDISGEGRATYMLVKLNGKWKIAAAQTTIIEKQ